MFNSYRLTVNSQMQCSADPAPAVGSPPLSITCVVTANVTIANREQLTSRLTEPFVFDNGVLTNIFQGQVTNYCLQQMALENQANLRTFSSGNWFPVSITVSNRFITGMGSDLFTTATRRFLAASIGVDLQNIQGNIMVRKNMCQSFILCRR